MREVGRGGMRQSPGPQLEEAGEEEDEAKVRTLPSLLVLHNVV